MCARLGGFRARASRSEPYLYYFFCMSVMWCARLAMDYL